MTTIIILYQHFVAKISANKNCEVEEKNVRKVEGKKSKIMLNLLNSNKKS